MSRMSTEIDGSNSIPPVSDLKLYRRTPMVAVFGVWSRREIGISRRMNSIVRMNPVFIPARSCGKRMRVSVGIIMGWM